MTSLISVSSSVSSRSVIFRRKRTESDHSLVSEGLREAITSYLQMTEGNDHSWDTWGKTVNQSEGMKPDSMRTVRYSPVSSKVWVSHCKRSSECLNVVLVDHIGVARGLSRDTTMFEVESYYVSERRLFLCPRRHIAELWSRDCMLARHPFLIWVKNWMYLFIYNIICTHCINAICRLYCNMSVVIFMLLETNKIYLLCVTWTTHTNNRVWSAFTWLN